jgi:CBS domain-containing protein
MPVADCMAKTLIPVPAGTTIAGFVAEMAVNGRGAAYPVVKDGAFLGLVTLQDTAAVPHVLWQQTPITAVMTAAERTPPIPVATPACDALAALDAHHVGELPVFEDGSLAGVVSKETIYAGVRDRERIGAA